MASIGCWIWRRVWQMLRDHAPRDSLGPNWSEVERSLPISHPTRSNSRHNSSSTRSTTSRTFNPEDAFVPRVPTVDVAAMDRHVDASFPPRHRLTCAPLDIRLGQTQTRHTPRRSTLRPVRKRPPCPIRAGRFRSPHRDSSHSGQRLMLEPALEHSRAESAGWWPPPNCRHE